MVLLIGLAVGVDYSMFYLKRERQERAAGRSPQAALEIAAATSGRSVLISGLTVIVAMAGMFLTGDPTFSSLALATILVVAVAVLGSLTVLPALLSRLGDKVDRGRVPLVCSSPPRRRGRADLGRDRRPRPASPGALRGTRRRLLAGCSPRRRCSCAWRLRALSRSRRGSRSSRRTTGCSRRSRAPRCRRTSSSRHRTCTRRRCRRRSPSSSDGRSRAAVRSSRSPWTSTARARWRTSPSRSQGTGPTPPRTRPSACCATRSCPRRSAHFRTHKPASPGRRPSGGTRRTR